jgi:hypothetical protein
MLDVGTSGCHPERRWLLTGQSGTASGDAVNEHPDSEPLADPGEEMPDDLSTEWAVRNRSGEIVLSGIGSREPAEAAARRLRGVAVYRIISKWREAPTYVRRRISARRR